MTKNTKHFTSFSKFFKLLCFALFFDNGFGEKDNKNSNFSLTTKKTCVILTKNTKRGKGYENISSSKTRYA